MQRSGQIPVKKNTISRNGDQLERKPSKFIPVLSMASNKVKKR